MLFQGQNRHEDHLLSPAGAFKTERAAVVPAALQQYLKEYPQIRTIRLHPDNDAIGRGAVEGIVRGLQNRYQIVDEPPVYGKDVNDFLMHKIHMKQEVTR